MPKALSIIGMTFNKLTVLAKSEQQIAGGVRWDCLCDCGETTWVTGSRLVNGVTRSCGCIAKSNSVGNSSNRVHGLSLTSEYRAWIDAKSRCLNSDAPQYAYYGGRGITMQATWINDFPLFFAYMGNKPSPLHSLDRIDNDLDYCEGNVRWATKQEQVANRGMNINNKTGVTGVNLVINPKNWHEHYKATWGPKGSKTNKSFSVEKYGKMNAFNMAVAARLKGLEELRLNSVYTDKHGEERKTK